MLDQAYRYLEDQSFGVLEPASPESEESAAMSRYRPRLGSASANAEDPRFHATLATTGYGWVRPSYGKVAELQEEQRATHGRFVWAAKDKIVEILSEGASSLQC